MFSPQAVNENLNCTDDTVVFINQHKMLAQ